MFGFGKGRAGGQRFARPPFPPDWARDPRVQRPALSAAPRGRQGRPPGLDPGLPGREGLRRLWWAGDHRRDPGDDRRASVPAPASEVGRRLPEAHHGFWSTRPRTSRRRPGTARTGSLPRGRKGDWAKPGRPAWSSCPWGRCPSGGASDMKGRPQRRRPRVRPPARPGRRSGRRSPDPPPPEPLRHLGPHPRLGI